MKFCVHDPNTSKIAQYFFQIFFTIKKLQKKYKNLLSIVWSKSEWSKKNSKQITEFFI